MNRQYQLVQESLCVVNEGSVLTWIQSLFSDVPKQVERLKRKQQHIGTLIKDSYKRVVNYQDKIDDTYMNTTPISKIKPKITNYNRLSVKERIISGWLKDDLEDLNYKEKILSADLNNTNNWILAGLILGGTVLTGVVAWYIIKKKKEGKSKQEAKQEASKILDKTKNIANKFKNKKTKQKLLDRIEKVKEKIK